MLQGESGEIGLDGINGEEVRMCCIIFFCFILIYQTESYAIASCLKLCGESHQCVYEAKTCKWALIYAWFWALIGICCMFSGQKWSGWTPRRQRKPWQKSEWLNAILALHFYPFFFTNLKWLVLINAHETYIAFRVPKVAKDKQET